MGFITWTFNRIPTPGKLFKDFSLFLGDIFTDTYAWSVFLREGHVMFAGFLATVSWASTLIQLKSGMLEELLDYARDSAAAGVPVMGWINLMDTEKGMEAM